MQPRIYDKVGYTIIKTFTCNKLSERAKGLLHYQLWQNNDDQSFALALSKNESSGGFSAELIQVTAITHALTELYRTAKPFHATALKGLFIGKSVNNASFLGAVLVDQGVIRLYPQATRLLEVTNQYELWPLTLDEHTQDQMLNSDDAIKATKRTSKNKIGTDQEVEDAIHQSSI